jgi:hypothetical protein
MAQTGGFCSGCGVPLSPGSTFCGSCGKKISPSGAQGPATVPLYQPQAAFPPPPSYSQPPQSFIQPGMTPHLTGRSQAGASTALFWIAWVVLALVSGLLLVDGLSFLRLGGFALLLLFPLLTRKLLFKKILPSLALWGATLMALLLIVALSPSSNVSPGGGGQELLSAQTLGGVTVSVLEGILTGNARVAVKPDSVQPVSLPGITSRSYEISLPPGSTLTGVAEIHLPVDKSLISSGLAREDSVAAGYLDPQTNAWAPVLYYLDGDEVVILTDHFSRFGVLYFKDGRKGLSESLPAFDSLPPSFFSDSELNKVVGDVSSGKVSSQTAFDKSWAEFNSYYNLSGASLTVLQLAVGSETLSNVNGLMTEIGMGFALTQLAFDIYQGDATAAVTNFTKNSAFYSASKWGGDAVGLAAAGATFIDISLTKFAEAALSKNLQKWEDAYRVYYETEPTAIRTAVAWYKIVRQLHASSASAADFRNKLDKALDDYCQIFWKDPEAYAHVAEATPGIVGFGAGGEYGQSVSELSNRYKAYLYHTTMQPVLATLMKNLWFSEYMKATASFNKLKAEMNHSYTVTVSLQNAASVANMAKTNVKFVDTTGKVAHSQSFDASGRVALNMTLFGFLKMGGPSQVDVSVPAQTNIPAFSWSGSYKLDKTTINMPVPYASQVPVTATSAKPATSTPSADSSSEGQIASQLNGAQITLKDLLSIVGWNLKSNQVSVSSQNPNMPSGDVVSSTDWRATTGDYRAVSCWLYYMAGKDPAESLWMTAGSFRASIIAQQGGTDYLRASSYNALPGGVFLDSSTIDYNSQGVALLYNYTCSIYFWVSPNYYGVVRYVTEGTANATAAGSTWRADYARLALLEYNRLSQVAGIATTLK